MPTLYSRLLPQREAESPACDVFFSFLEKKRASSKKKILCAIPFVSIDYADVPRVSIGSVI